MATKNIAVKKKKKVWLSIYSPEFLGNVFLGESYVYGKEELVGKTLDLNLATITNDMKKQNINVSFRVTGVEEGKGQTKLVDYVLSPSHIKRMIRRKRNKIEDSFLVRMSDGRIVRVKPIAITNNEAYKSIVQKLRAAMKDMIKRAARQKTYEEFITDLLSLKFQKEMKDRLNKVYPLKYVDVRQAVLEEKGKVTEEVETFLEPVVDAEEEDFEDSEEQEAEGKDEPETGEDSGEEPGVSEEDIEDK
jgi:small subunit ribosomal protein S3Ae